MRITFSHLAKATVVMAAVMIFSTYSVRSVRAETAEGGMFQGWGSMEMLLQQIAQNTMGSLQALNNFPLFLSNLTLAVLSNTWTLADNTDTTAAMQANLGNYGNALIQQINTRNSLQQQLTKDLLGETATPQSMPYANDMVYTTLLNMPYFNPDPRNPHGAPPTANPPYNYIKNVSGINISHVIPSLTWDGKAEDIRKYYNYYNAVISVQSHDAYILSNVYADYLNGGALTSMQTNLIQQASTSSWFQQVASENLTIVFRQLLMYESQIFVLLSQLLEAQKQQLATQAMTNTLIILNNQTDEELMVQKATGAKPGA